MLLNSNENARLLYMASLTPKTSSHDKKKRRLYSWRYRVPMYQIPYPRRLVRDGREENDSANASGSVT